MHDFSGDIPLSIGQAAHNGTSWVPEQRGAYEVKSHAEELRADYGALLSLCAGDAGKLATLETEFARFRAGYKKHKLNYLYSRSRCVSSFIAGPSKFPAARMNKRADISHKRLNDLLNFRTRALKAIRKVLNPEKGAIYSGDADAIERLEEKITQAENLQHRMKEANAAIRRFSKAGKACQIGALVALGLKEAQAASLLEKDFAGRIGFASYELTNNGANIRRMKERVEALSISKAAPSIETEHERARLEVNRAENRVRLFFAGKPNEATRERLKRGGFRWTPSLECWQAYVHAHTVELAALVAGPVLKAVNA